MQLPREAPSRVCWITNSHNPISLEVTRLRDIKPRAIRELNLGRKGDEWRKKKLRIGNIDELID